MSWVTIDYDKCNSCGTCLEVCRRCFFLENETVVVHADEDCCSLCGHCASICPLGAIEHHEMDMDNFIDISKDEFITTEDFFEFIRQRRSHRHFKKQSIPKEDMNRLIDIVRYSPTGSNSQNVEVVVIQDAKKIQRLSNLAVDFMASGGEQSARRLQELKAEGKGAPEQLAVMEMMARYGEMMKQSREMGDDPVFYQAPAVIVFHSSKEGRSQKDNCVIASTTMGLLARTMGLEFTYIGIFEAAANESPPAMEELKLPKGHAVYSVIIIGYPKLKFLRTVDRKPTAVRWE
jgi:nitroreductase/NAD-dependent dihydropyrimidine dehydrogenase PreA subunit